MTKPKIAYVDDDLNNLTHYQKILSEKFNVDTYLKSVDFLEKIESIHYDCYLIDVFMPVLDGFELLDKIKMHNENKLVPAFIITSNPCDEVRVNSYRTGATDFIDRLIKSDELIIRIESKINKYKEISPVLKIGNLKLHLKHLASELNNRVLDLTLLEYKLLTGLIQKHPQKITKPEFVNLIWGESAINENNLNTHLYNLRKKTQDWDYEISHHRSDGFGLTKK